MTRQDRDDLVRDIGQHSVIAVEVRQLIGTICKPQTGQIGSGAKMAVEFRLRSGEHVFDTAGRGESASGAGTTAALPPTSSAAGLHPSTASAVGACHLEWDRAPSRTVHPIS